MSEGDQPALATPGSTSSGSKSAQGAAKSSRPGRSDDARIIVSSSGNERLAGSTDKTLVNAGLSADEGFTEQDYGIALDRERLDTEAALSVYVHLPFCPSRCLTCDHQTSVSHDHRQIDRYLDSLEREIQLVTDHLGKGRKLQQLHLGGGTPNYLSEVQLVRLIDIIDAHFTISSDTETSLEANAHRASLSQLSLLHGLGFRALNLEVRDLDATVQQALGRHQSPSVVRDVVESARQIGFKTVSTDLVYGLPMQSAASIERTLAQLIELAPDRIACYTYSRRPDLFQHQRAIEGRLMPSLADKVAIFSRIVDGLCGSGFEWIGLDCFAQHDDAIAQAHRSGDLHRNWIGYTAQSGRNMLGFGSSSMSDLSTICVHNHSAIGDWQDSLDRGLLPVSEGVKLSPRTRARRNALSDLMCNLQFEDNQHTLLDEGHEDPALAALRDDGLIEVSGDRLIMTESGRYTLHQLWGDSSPSYRWRQLA